MATLRTRRDNGIESTAAASGEQEAQIKAGTKTPEKDRSLERKRSAVTGILSGPS
jgi:hypothetical protein